MSKNNGMGIPSPLAVPGKQSTYAELLDEFPELAGEIGKLTAPLDVGNQDRRSKSFEKQYPSLRPRS